MRIAGGGVATVNGPIRSNSLIWFQASGTLNAAGGFGSDYSGVIQVNSGTAVITGDANLPAGNDLTLAILCAGGTLRIEGSYNGGGSATAEGSADATIEIAGEYNPAKDLNALDAGTVTFLGVNLPNVSKRKHFRSIGIHHRF